MSIGSWLTKGFQLVRGAARSAAQSATPVASFVGASLKLKLALLMVTILGLTVGIAPWGAIKTQERQLLQAHRDRLGTLHDMLSKAVVDTCVMTGKTESVQKVFEAVSNHLHIERVRLFQIDGLISHSSDRTELNRRLSPAELVRYYGQPDPVLTPRNGEPPTYSLVRPLFNGPECQSCHPSDGKVLGILEVSLSLEPMQRQLGSLKRSAASATAATVCLIVVGVWVALTRLVDQPLQQLVDVMGRAKHGDLTVRAPTRRRDEIGRLAQHFNDMIEKLETAKKEIEHYHQQQLVRADRLATIGEMAAAIAHEIRNPLTGISGVLSVLGRDFPAEDPRREVIDQTHLLIDRLNKSVESILHYSRPSPLQLRKVSMEEVIDRTLVLLEGELRKAGVEIRRETGAAAVPPVSADPHQLQQVLMNIVLNAIQACSAGSVIRIATEHACEAGQSYACMEVWDDGKGMSDEEASRAFQPFVSSKAEGTGLGLPIAKQIMERHLGRIDLHSVPGKGTRVRILVPAHLEARGKAS